MSNTEESLSGEEPLFGEKPSNSKEIVAWKAPEIHARPILVVKAGPIGRRIACTWVAAGYNVNLLDNSRQKATEGYNYVLNHVEEYSERIGSTKRGAITVSGDHRSARTADAWLAIETVPDRPSEKVNILGELDRLVPKDCIICTTSMLYKTMFISAKVDAARYHRVINFCPYLLPDIRVVELIPHEKTNSDILIFLSERISATGSLPIVAKGHAHAFIFKSVWDAIKSDVLTGLSDRETAKPALVDKEWVLTLYCSPLGLARLMDALSEEYESKLQLCYDMPKHLETSPLGRLKAVYEIQGSLIPALKEPQDSSPPEYVTNATQVYFAKRPLFGTVDARVNFGCIMCRTPYSREPLKKIIDGLHFPYGLDIHQASKRIYWGDLVDEDIKSCNLDGSDIKVVVPSEVEVTPDETGSTKPEQIVIDQSSDKLYWTMNEHLAIFRSNLDGSALEIILQTSPDSSDASNPALWPIGIALDPLKGHFYWSQRDPRDEAVHRILRANIEIPPGCTPVNRTDIELIFADLPEVFSLEFAPIFEELYWSAQGGENQQGTELWRGFVYGEKKRHLVKRRLDGGNWIKLDPRAGHLYATGYNGYVWRFAMLGVESAASARDIMKWREELSDEEKKWIEEEILEEERRCSGQGGLKREVKRKDEERKRDQERRESQFELYHDSDGSCAGLAVIRG